MRFADDLLVMCKSRQQAQAALTRLRELLADLGLAPKEAKTRIVELAVGRTQKVSTFSAFTTGWCARGAPRQTRGVEFLAPLAQDRAMRPVRATGSPSADGSVPAAAAGEEVVEDLNRFLRGWAGYFRYGNSAARFRKIEQHARLRLAVFIGKRHKRGRGFGWSVTWPTSRRKPRGLLSLDGTVIAPRAAKPWRGKAECRR